MLAIELDTLNLLPPMLKKFDFLQFQTIVPGPFLSFSLATLKYVELWPLSLPLSSKFPKVK